MMMMMEVREMVVIVMMLVSTLIIGDYDEFVRGQLGSSTWTNCSGFLTRTETDPSTSRFITIITTNIVIIIFISILIMIIKEFMIATDMSSCGDPAEKLR